MAANNRNKQSDDDKLEGKNNGNNNGNNDNPNDKKQPKTWEICNKTKSPEEKLKFCKVNFKLSEIGKSQCIVIIST